MSRQMERTLGFSGPQRLVLREIIGKPGILPGELAGVLGIHPSTVTGLVDALESSGLAERRRDENDRRSVRLFATPAGSAALELRVETVESVLGRVTGEFSPAERKLVTTFLGRVSTALRTASDADT
jgi:DNA-binding MarR family transcriptional regulator